MIELIKLYILNGDVCVRFMKVLYIKVIGDMEMKYYDVCKDCNGLFLEDFIVYRCVIRGCLG